MAKYIAGEDMQKNHIYEDAKRKQYIYLGRASQDNGCWNYPLCYIYITKERLDKYPSFVSLASILCDLSAKGVRTYSFTEKPKKLIRDVGIDSRHELHGVIGDFTFID